MNFRRIFLVECLLLLFPSVKCSDTNRIYMAVNETVLLSITGGRSAYDVAWATDKMKLLQKKGSEIKYYANKEQCRCNVFPNGTLLIQQVVKEDSGNYTVTVYQQDGKLETEEHTMFIVQEPVPQPILSSECRNKTLSVKCEVKQKTEDDIFTIELIQDNVTKIQKNATKVEMQTRNSGMFRCVVKNQVSEKKAEKVLKCSVGQLDVYLILSIAGGAIFFVIFVILLIYCIRKKKAERLEDDEEERMIRARKLDREMVVRELPQTPCNPTPKQLRVQQRPLPQPQVQQQALPPRPRPRTQQQTPNHPRDKP